jgi:competence protein ComEA
MPELTRPQLLAYAIAGLVVLVLGVRYLQQSEAPAQPAGGRPVASSGADAGGASVRLEPRTPARALVHVAGAVRHPGVYRLTDGARVKDAVRRAGGPRRGADVNAINLAAKVADGQQVVVPRRAAAGAFAGSAPVPGPDAAAGGGPPAAPISLNSATAAQLDTLDGVGPATAQKILDWRREHGGFRTVDDLGEVPGIGPKRLAALRDKVQP